VNVAHIPDVILPDAAEIGAAMRTLRRALHAGVDDREIQPIAGGIAASYRERCRSDRGPTASQAASTIDDILEHGGKLLKLLNSYGGGAYGLGATATMEFGQPLSSLDFPDQITEGLRGDADYLKNVLSNFLQKLPPRRRRWDLRGNRSVRERYEGMPRDVLVNSVYLDLWVQRRPDNSPDCQEFRAACYAVLDLSGVQHGPSDDPQDAAIVLKHALDRFLAEIAEK
jgi:hypothetical protein